MGGLPQSRAVANDQSRVMISALAPASCARRTRARLRSRSPIQNSWKNVFGLAASTSSTATLANELSPTAVPASAAPRATAAPPAGGTACPPAGDASTGRERSGPSTGVAVRAALPSPAAGDLATAGALLAVPVGATEQHGPHLPLSTDTDLAVALCARLAAARPGVLAAPPLAYGASGEHEDFPGTLSIGTEAVELLLVELCRSATRAFSRVLLVSTHGGNAEAVRRAERRLRAESRDVLAWLAAGEGDAHAGRAETSLELALAPDRVRPGRAQAGNTRPLTELMPRLR